MRGFKVALFIGGDYVLDWAKLSQGFLESIVKTCKLVASTPKQHQALEGKNLLIIYLQRCRIHAVLKWTVQEAASS